MEVHRLSDIKYSDDYNPDPDGYIRHNGKFFIENVYDTIDFGEPAIRRWSLYFFENGSFYIYAEPDSDLFAKYPEIRWRTRPSKEYGIYKVIDSTMLKINLYYYNPVLHMHNMHTDYYRIINDSTIYPFKMVVMDGEELALPKLIYRFVKVDSMPKFDIPIERYRWMRRKKNKRI